MQLPDSFKCHAKCKVCFCEKVILKPLSHWNVNWRLVCELFATFSQQRLMIYKQNFHVAVSLNGHLCDKLANFGLILKIYLSIVARLWYDPAVRVSHDVPTNVAFVFIFICMTVTRHLFSCQMVACFLKTVARLLYDILRVS